MDGVELRALVCVCVGVCICTRRLCICVTHYFPQNSLSYSPLCLSVPLSHRFLSLPRDYTNSPRASHDLQKTQAAIQYRERETERWRWRGRGRGRERARERDREREMARRMLSQKQNKSNRLTPVYIMHTIKLLLLLTGNNNGNCQELSCIIKLPFSVPLSPLLSCAMPIKYPPKWREGERGREAHS